MKKRHIIQIKRYTSGELFTDIALRKKYYDTASSYSKIEFIGTDAEYSEFLDEARKDHTRFKVLWTVSSTPICPECMKDVESEDELVRYYSETYNRTVISCLTCKINDDEPR